MKPILLLIFITLFPMAQAQRYVSQIESDCAGENILLDQFQWENRVIVMFDHDSDSDAYRSQMNLFMSLKDELLDRDLILISIFDEECAKLNDEIIPDSSAYAIRARLAPTKNGYSIFLIGKDGGVKLKQDEVLASDELFRVIDKMPMRQREMKGDRYRN